ncbi:CTP synthase C-terminal region-related (seleno)protein [Dactylosporangium matsuzakiense]|uniref:CTP synthase C-terminal region-related (seleno)protein n=1 Tax=Dactylosporangium matsuzakiense TaxID=53360 RepID=UPI0022F33815|nr:gamma-glutamyl-gamma-aminobutyrate hydrolase family protein [Dactylosporangium matsuzakiense]
MTTTRTARVALVGDRSAHVRSHTRIPGLIEVLREQHGLALDAYWVPSEEADADALAGFDGIWLIPGSPYRSEAGALAAVRAAREHRVAFLGTCGGFQHLMLEMLRDVAGRPDAAHAENDPAAASPAIVPLSCSLVGHEGAVNLRKGSLAEQIFGVERTVERYHCAYGLDRAYLPLLEAHGLRFTGHDDDGEVRVAELADHPFLVGTLFQPELSGDGTRVHAVIRAFAEAAVAVGPARETAAA